MKFIHVGDTHIGRNWPSNIGEKRIAASVAAFDFIVTCAIDHKVDFIVHTGDFFDKVYPWHSAVKKIGNILNRLREHGIPLYIIRGNHDGQYDYGGWKRGVAIEVLEREGMVDLIDPKTDPERSKGFRIHDENTVIYGVGYYAYKTLELIHECAADIDTSKFNILLLHSFMDQYTGPYPNQPSLPLMELVEKGFDYIAIGHDHKPREPLRIADTYVVASGSTIKFNFEEADDRKIVYLVEGTKGNITITLIPVPQDIDLIKISVKIDDLDEGAIIEEVTRRVNEKLKGPAAIKVILNGELKLGHTLEDIPIDTLREHYEGMANVLLFDIVRKITVVKEPTEPVTQGAFQLEEYLGERLNEEFVKRIVSLHGLTRDYLGNEECLTSGDNLKKEWKEDIKNEIHERWFKDVG